MHGLFFTGTDTGVGKTHVVAAVARVLRRQGWMVSVSKPVATGATWVAGRWLAPDTERLIKAAGPPASAECVTPWAFPEPVAPPVAARLHGAVLTLDGLSRAVRNQARPDGVLLVEGVGGLLCPLTERETIADLAAELRFPVVVVARRSLGTLNHTLLTLEVARGRGLNVAGVVVNETEPPDGLAAETNVAELQRRSAVPILAVVSYRAAGQADDDAALSAVDWAGLAGAR